MGTIEREPEVIDNLTSTSTLDALSANQGKVLNEKIPMPTVIETEWYTKSISTITVPAHGRSSTTIPQYTERHPSSNWVYIGSLFCGAYNDNVIPWLNSVSSQNLTMQLSNITASAQSVSMVGNFGVYLKAVW